MPIMPLKPRKGAQLATGNKGEIKDVGGDRLREGVVDSGHLAPPGGPSGPGFPPSLYDVFVTPGTAPPGPEGPEGPEGPQGISGLTGATGSPGLAAAKYVGFSSGSQGSGNGSLTVAVPAGVVAGDLLVAFVGENGDTGLPAIANPSGWTAIRTTNSSFLGQNAAYRIVSSEPASYTWTADRTGAWSGGILAYRNGVIVSGENSGQGDNPSSNITAPSIASTVANATLVAGFSIVAGGGISITVPVSMTDRTGDISASATHLHIADEVQVLIGATGNRVAVASASGYVVGQMVLIEPSAIGPIGPQGERGVPGPEGPEGPEGPQGVPGLTGADGSVGAQGPVGLEGQEGLEGPLGPQGLPGQDGAVGPVGTQGIQGPPGNDGEDGPTGPQGIQGPIGLDGPTGPPGQEGPEGPEGPMGAVGPAGLNGADGVQGTPGVDGSDGDAGSPGVSANGVATALSSYVPIGGIIMWAGLLTNIPVGWNLCDGTNGTPDLRQRMVRGNRPGVDPGTVAGSDTHTHDSHTFTTAGVIVAMVPVVSGPVTHATASNLPVYFEVAFIQRIS